MTSYCSEYYDQYFTGVPGDAEFYVECATDCEGEVLELGCGTGRILVPIAATDKAISGIDIDPELLAIAQKKLDQIPSGKENGRLAAADMTDFELGREFGLVIVPYRTFQHLLTPADQQEALRTIAKHLKPGGALVFDIFDPQLQLADTQRGSPLSKDTDFAIKGSGNRVVVWYAREFDPEAQIMEQELLFEEIDRGNRVVSQIRSRLTLRYSFRYEVEYLLEKCGFEPIELLGDFYGGSYKGYGEQIWRAIKV